MGLARGDDCQKAQLRKTRALFCKAEALTGDRQCLARVKGTAVCVLLPPLERHGQGWPWYLSRTGYWVKAQQYIQYVLGWRRGTGWHTGAWKIKRLPCLVLRDCLGMWLPALDIHLQCLCNSKKAWLYPCACWMWMHTCVRA